MVSADNLNLDVLELIFAYLSGNDLVSVCLVSRSFFAGVIPRLYHTLGFRINQSKKFPHVLSPFAAVMAHPDFAIHVRHIDIRRIPSIQSHYHPDFIRDCTAVISAANNLSSFTLTVDALPPFLPALQQKERLRDLRIYANLTSDQSTKLVGIRGLRNLILDYPSWNLVDMIPSWTRNLPSLTSLTLFMASDMNETILRQALANLPNLTGLQVIGCGKLDHISVLKLATQFTRNLESLAMTTYESPRPLPTDLPPLPHLRHIALDTHTSLSPPPPSTPSLWTQLFKLTSQWSCPLTSVTLKLSERLMVSDTFAQMLMDGHGETLRTLIFVRCRISLEALKNICASCGELYVLGVAVPAKDVEPFIDALAQSDSLTTLIDMATDKHTSSGAPRVSLAKDTVQDIMEATNIRLILTETRRWTGVEADEFMSVTAKLERRKPVSLTHWFMPKA